MKSADVMSKDSFYCESTFFDVIKSLISASIIWLIRPGGIVFKLVGNRTQIWDKFRKILIFLETIIGQILSRWIITFPIYSAGPNWESSVLKSSVPRNLVGSQFMEMLPTYLWLCNFLRNDGGWWRHMAMLYL